MNDQEIAVTLINKSMFYKVDNFKYFGVWTEKTENYIKVRSVGMEILQ